jgi:hypothetical protein
MKTSETIGEFVKALAQAQGQFTAAQKTGANPLFKSSYATLDDVINAIRQPLTANGLSFIQPLLGDGESYTLETVIFHNSGEWISSATVIPHLAGNRGTNELQAFGTALTYMRRYMLTSMLGINAEEDNDGNGHRATAPAPPRPQKKRPTVTPAGNAVTAISEVFGDEAGKEYAAEVKPPPGQKPRKTPSFLADTLDLVVKAGYAKDIPAAARRLGKSQVLGSNDAPDIIVSWAGTYDALRKAGKTSDESAAEADAELYAEMYSEGETS